MALQPILDLSFTGAQGATQIVDSSPYQHPMTCSGGAAVDVVAGEPRMRFTGSGSFVHTPDSPAFTLAEKSWEISFKARLNASGDHAFLAQYNGSNGNDVLEVTHRSGQGVRVFVKRAGSTVLNLAQSGSPMSVGVDYDLTIRRSGTSVEVLRNGVIVLSGSMSGDMPDPTSPFYLGYAFYSNNASNSLNGWLDTVRVLKDDVVPPPPPPPPVAWRPGQVVVSRYAPLGVNASGNASGFLFVNTTIPSTYANLPMTTYPAPGLFVPQSWIDLDVKALCGIPTEDEVLAVKVGGIIGLTMGQTNEVGDLHVHLRNPVYPNNNYIFQSDSVFAGGGDRDMASTTVGVEDGKIKFAWWVSSPLDYPVHSAYFFNLNLHEYIRAAA